MGATDIASVGGDSALTAVPTTLGVISIAYNPSGVDKLNLDADTLAGIFLGHIKKWNDLPRALNPHQPATARSRWSTARMEVARRSTSLTI